MKTGNRVFHKGMQRYGTVRVVDGVGVAVEYDRENDKPLHELYDRKWFDLHPDVLVVTDRVAD